MATKKIAVEKTVKEKVIKGMDFSVSLEDLLEAGAHFGHQVRRWNPKMKKFIWSAKDGVHIFDLAKTAESLKTACEYLYQVASEGKVVVMLGTKRQAKEIIEEVAGAANIPYISERWMGGTVTNWEQIKGRINKLVDMKDKKEKGEFNRYTKKEQLLLDREILRLERFFGGLSKLPRRPEVLFVVDTHKERVAIREAVNKGLVVVGMTDSNANPDFVDYPIPANDDALRSIKLVVESVGRAIAAGMEKSKQEEK